MADAEIIQLQSCFDCANAYFSPRGTYCSTFNEVIIDETDAAVDCSEFERA